MLSESRPYKAELLRLATTIDRWHRQPNWTDRRVFAYEKNVFLAFYLVRRLAESHKLADALVKRPIPVQAFRPTGELVTLMSRDDVWELYDLEKPERVRLPLSFVCNQLIHSYVFNIWIERGGRASSIFFSSDRQRRKLAYRMTRGTLTSVLRKVGSNYPKLAEFAFDPIRQDYQPKLA